VTTVTDDFHERLRLLCRRQGVRPIDLARKLKVDKAAVSRWLNGGSKPRKSLDEVLAALGLTVAQFYRIDLTSLRAAVKRKEAA